MKVMFEQVAYLLLFTSYFSLGYLFVCFDVDFDVAPNCNALRHIF